MAEPRVVFVYRPTEYEQLRGTYGTIKAASFYSNVAVASTSTRRGVDRIEEVAAGSRYGTTATTQESGGQGSSLNATNVFIDELRQRHDTFAALKKFIAGYVPAEWRQANCPRDALDRFLFEPDDIVCVIGQDGLVANVAKYLRDRQLVVGFNPEPDRWLGVLTRFEPVEAPEVFKALAQNTVASESRPLVRATLDNGSVLVGLNEIFIGHHSHQSARYEITYGKATENQSSSGMIVATGSGVTGWASSMMRTRDPVRLQRVHVPGPTDDELVFLVREPWVSPKTGATVTEGNIGDHYPDLLITSEMEADGVIFADGIEADHLDFNFGSICEVDIADQRLHLALH